MALVLVIGYSNQKVNVKKIVEVKKLNLCQEY
jgi:hypothetical protein